jgi:hypothetical protein
MATLDSVYLQRWTFVQPVSVVGELVRGNAIPDYFLDHPEVGSPIDGEVDWDEVPGGRLQPFTGAVLGWDPDNGTRVITG